MLPNCWNTARLLVEDAATRDLNLVAQCLAESQDVAHLDPAFGPAPEDELKAMLARSLNENVAGQREFQMQMLRLNETGETVGYWHFVAVPKKPALVGVSIMLIRPAYRRQGYGAELVASAVPRFRGVKGEVWARVYLGNSSAIEFWSRLGFITLARRSETYVLPPAEAPSIILSRPVP